MPPCGASKRTKKMKTRWLKSVVDHSKEAAPALPYQRQVRHAARQARMVVLLRSLRSA